MMQGDSYGLMIEIINMDGTPLTLEDVSDVEISVGLLRKTFADGEVVYADGYWVFPLSQEETFKLPSGKVKAQARVVWANGGVKGCSLGDIRVKESLSKVVLS